MFADMTNMTGFSRIRMFNHFEVHNTHIKIEIGHKYRHYCSITITCLFSANKTNDIYLMVDK
jgi:hypothetical protein